jgi:alkaline phosphatase
MSYEIDRDNSKEPSLAEMTKSALETLNAATLNDPASPGFFLMVEGSRIDMAAHSNDPGTHAREILSYHNTVAVVRDFVNAHPDTIMVSTSDHETGVCSLDRTGPITLN